MAVQVVRNAHISTYANHHQGVVLTSVGAAAATWMRVWTYPPRAYWADGERAWREVVFWGGRGRSTMRPDEWARPKHRRMPKRAYLAILVVDHDVVGLDVAVHDAV